MSKEQKSQKSVLDNARSHFRSALSQELQSVEVPEWNSTIWFKVATNFAVEQKIIELHGKGHLVEALVETLISKALHEDGSRMFTAADKIVLMRDVDPEVIISVVTAINEAKASAKEALGN